MNLSEIRTEAERHLDDSEESHDPLPEGLAVWPCCRIAQMCLVLVKIAEKSQRCIVLADDNLHLMWCGEAAVAEQIIQEAQAAFAKLEEL